MSLLGWALSPLDFQSHAVDRTDDHPVGVWIALCGHRMLWGELESEPLGGSCGHCAGLVVAHRVPSPGVVRWVRSPDGRCHAVAGLLAGADELVEAMCGERLPSGELVATPRPAGVLCLRCVAGDPAHPSPQPPAAAGAIMHRIESGGVLSRRERIELGTLVRLAAVASRLVAGRPDEADRAVWLADAWEPVRAQVERMLDSRQLDAGGGHR